MAEFDSEKQPLLIQDQKIKKYGFLEKRKKQKGLKQVSSLQNTF